VANEQVTVRFAAEIQQYQANVKQAQKLLNMFGISAEQEANRVSKSVASMVAQYASLTLAINAVQNVVKEGINFNKFVEVSTAAFGTMMKSVSGAKTVMQDLFNFAVNSPLTFKETVASSRQLMAYGFQVKELIPTIQMLGTVGKATGVSLDDMAYVYGTLRSQGRAYTRDLMQFAMRGIPIYEELAKVMGVPVKQLQKLTEAGKVSFKEVEQAFLNMTSGTGKFAGYFDEYMKTFEGKMSMLSDIAQQAAGTLTESLFGVLKRNVDDFISILKNNKSAIASIGKDLGKLASGFFDIVKALIPLIPLLLKLIPLLIAKEVFSAGLKMWRALPEVFNALGSSIGIATNALKAFGAGGALVPGMTSSFAMLSRAVTGFGASFVSALPAIAAVVAPIAAIAAAIMGVAYAIGEIKKEEAKLQTDKAYATAALGNRSPNLNAFPLQRQIQMVEQLQKTYGSLSTVQLARILLTQNKISEEAYKQLQLAKELADEQKRQKGGAYGAKPIMDPAWYRFAKEYAGTDIAIKGMNKEGTYYIYSVTEALKAFEDQVTSSEDMANKFYAALGREPPKKDMVSIYTKALETYKNLIEQFQMDTNLMKISGTSGSEASQYYNGLLDKARWYFDELEKLKEKEKPKEMDKFFAWGWDVKESRSAKAALDLEAAKAFSEIMNKQDITEQERNQARLNWDKWYQKEKLKLEERTVKETELIWDDYLKIYKDLTVGNKEMWDALKMSAAVNFMNGDIGKALVNVVKASFEDTYIGKVAQGYKGRQTGVEGKGGVPTSLNIGITSLMVLWDGLKGLGKFIMQIVTSSEPIQNVLNAVTTSVLYALMPTIESLANGLTWLYDTIIVPVGNAIIDIINQLIRFINKTFGSNINTMNHLLTTTEALAKAQEDEVRKLKAKNAMDALSETISYLQGKLDDLVGSQVKSLQDLYEVGAISADEYAKKVEEVSGPYKKATSVSASDQSLTSMADIFQRLTDLYAVQGRIDAGDMSDADIEALLSSVGISYKTPAATISEGVLAALNAYGAATTVSSGTVSREKAGKIDSLMVGQYQQQQKLASGTDYIPQDMPATVHRGEMIIPADFSSAIRRGDLSLSGSSASGGSVNVVVNVAGSVKEENDLAVSIANAIYKQRRSGVLTV
jgi:tape measure domain-containing protein